MGMDEVKEFERHLNDSRFYAMFMKGRKVATTEKLDFVSFRFRFKTFHFSSALSYPVREEVAKALRAQDTGRTAFTLKGGPLLEFLKAHFQWTPSNVVEATQLRGSATLETMSRAMTHGPYCRRAKKFIDARIPSPIALDHCAITVRLIYDFCIKFGEFADEESRCDELRRGDDEKTAASAISRFAPARRRRVFPGSFPLPFPRPSTASFPLSGSIPSSSSLILQIGAFLRYFASLRYLRLFDICVTLRYPRLSALQTSTYLRSGFFCLLNHVI